MRAYTEEQRSIINFIADIADCENPKNNVVIVKALAGTGKTSTFEGAGLAIQELQKTAVYLVFNKSAQEEAKSRLPPSVTPVTTHSMAYSSFGAHYKNKLTSNMRPKDIVTYYLREIQSLPYGRHDGDKAYVMANAILERLNHFISSSQTEGQFFFCTDTSPPSHERGIHVLTDWLAHKVWSDMKSRVHPTPMTHDGYLKMYQLSGSYVKDFAKYDFIFLDEAQDTNMAVFAMLMKSRRPVVLVGDPYQNIYSFRKSVNVLNQDMVLDFNPDACISAFHLTGSFRFNQDIADNANCVLSLLGAEKDHQLKGLGAAGYSVSKKAILCRTNAGLIDVVAKLMQKSKEKSFKMLGGSKGYNTQKTLDAYHMMIGERHRVRDPFLNQFKDYDALKAYSGSSQDQEIRVVTGIVDRHKKNIPDIIDCINQSDSNLNPTIVLCTAHKAKGAEFDACTVYSDFPSLVINTNKYGLILKTEDFIRGLKKYYGISDDDFILDDSGQHVIPLGLDEFNLYYVALTRARYVLQNLTTNEAIIEEFLQKQGIEKDTKHRGADLGH